MSDSKLPIKRKAYGTAGRQTNVLANYFEITRRPKATTFVKYSVEIKKPYVAVEGKDQAQGHREPKPPQVEIKRKVFKEIEIKKGSEWFANLTYFFDGDKTLYTTTPLNMKTNFVVTSVVLLDEQDLRGKPNEFQVHISKIQEDLDLSELDTYINAKSFKWEYFNMESLKALNDLVHSSPSNKYFQFRDSILDPNARQSLGGGMELWAGFFESVRPGQNTFFVNVNRTHCVFYEKRDLATFLCLFLGLDRLPQTFDPQLRRRIDKVIRNLKVRPIHRPQVKTRQTIRGLSSLMARDYKFTMRDTDETNVHKYFKDVYDINLKYQHIVEIATRNEVWPLECCEIIEGQRVPLAQLSGDILAKMITFTALLPKRGMEMILNEGIQKVLDFGRDPKLRKFDMEIDQKMAVVPSRVLQAPTIYYHSKSKEGPKLLPNGGVWNLRGRMFVKSGAPLKYWFVISCVPESCLPRTEIEDFVVTLVKTCQGQGMDIVMTQPNIVYTSCNPNFKRTLQTEHNNSRKFLPNRPQMILFLLPPEVENKRKKKKFPRNIYDRKLNQRIYGDIKFVTSTVLGLPSQCIVADNIYEGPSYCANVALKMNLKMGGINSTLGPNEIPELTKEPVLLLGADVTHPTQSEGLHDDFPSICAVVGSVDQHGSKFIDRHREQKKKKEGGEDSKKNVSEEKIIDMQDMVREILVEYKERNRFLPKKIIMYRDGVSESQYKMVLDHELKAIENACKDLKEPNYNPPITFIVVGKRHHTRFYPQAKNDSDRNGNCVPGMIIDRKITHPYLFDFFLTSHSSLQGTSRPAHYIVLYDRNEFKVDSLQEFTYKLCYNYQRATRSVSIPPPVYYAHLSAKHARSHVISENGRSELRPVIPQLARSNPMYFT